MSKIASIQCAAFIRKNISPGNLLTEMQKHGFTPYFYEYIKESDDKVHPPSYFKIGTHTTTVDDQGSNITIDYTVDITKDYEKDTFINIAIEHCTTIHGTATDPNAQVNKIRRYSLRGIMPEHQFNSTFYVTITK